MSAILRHINSIGPKNILVSILAVWFIFLIFMALPMLNTHIAPSTDTKTAERLTRALEELEALRKQNQELQEIFRDMTLGLVS